jgi:hypothetical protein
MNDTCEQILQERLQDAERCVEQIPASSEQELGSLARSFQDLAQRITLILASAGRIVDGISTERVALIGSSIQSLSPSVRAFVRQRLEAAADVLEALRAESACLIRLSSVTRGQKSIVRETEMLRVLTKIEVARLGSDGQGFQYLADELDDFSQALHGSVGELSRHTGERAAAIEAARRLLAGQLPRIRQEFAALEAALQKAITRAEAGMAELSEVPTSYRACVEEIASLIAGVVAAIQTHDVTRQQIEHVCGALASLREMSTGPELAAADGHDSRPALLQVGLRVQSYQLRSAGRTAAGWIAQIRSCLQAMMRISSSDLTALGATVLDRERELSTQLAGLERFDRGCRAGEAEVQESLRGIEALMLLVKEHLEKSKSIRDRLRLLMFNSIVEAGRLGSRADGIREISMSIRRLSTRWKEITSQSEQILEQMLALARQSQQAIQSFAGAEGPERRISGSQSAEALQVLRSAAACAESEGRQLETASLPLPAIIAAIGAGTDRLESCFSQLDRAVEAIEAAGVELARDPGIDADPGSGNGSHAAEFEQVLSGSYTTEMERAVMRAALAGAALPEIQQSCCGNDVELF